MKYRYEATTIEGAVQLIAASYLRHGYYWYVTGRIPPEKDAKSIDRKLIDKYDIDLSEWERSHRKKRGLANAHYLRCNDWFILLVSEGHHQIKQPSHQGGEAESLKDCRRIPIKLAGYSISYRRSSITDPSQPSTKWRSHVRIDDQRYKELKSRFEYLANHRSPENLALEFSQIPFARYAPIRRQLLNIHRTVNKLRQQRGFDLLPYSVLNLRRTPVKVFVEPSTTVATPSPMHQSPLSQLSTVTP